MKPMHTRSCGYHQEFVDEFVACRLVYESLKHSASSFSIHLSLASSVILASQRLRHALHQLPRLLLQLRLGLAEHLFKNRQQLRCKLLDRLVGTVI